MHGVMSALLQIVGVSQVADLLRLANNPSEEAAASQGEEAGAPEEIERAAAKLAAAKVRRVGAQKGTRLSPRRPFLVGQ